MQAYASDTSKKQSSGNLTNTEKKIVWWAIKLRLFISPVLLYKIQAKL